MLSLAFLTFAAIASFASAQNNDAVVLVHGLGGQSDNWATYINEFEDAGFEVVAVDIGKFTSAHERVAELYAQLKGTLTDFGVCRSREFGHERFGKDFTGQGLLPDWDENNKIHLVGHSYGGPTIVLLEKMLREGSGCPEDTSPLFTGGNKNWITSMTSMSGVLSGTSLVDNFADLNVLDLIEILVVFAGELISETVLGEIFEVDFAHWGLNKQPDETIAEFFERAKDSQLLSEDNTAISSYDLSKKGAREINAFGELTYPETYYYAFAVERTNPFKNCFLWFCGEEYQVPSPLMLIFLHPFATMLGSLDTDAVERENDGLVNRINQICPIVTEDQRSDCPEFKGTWTPGKWFHQNVRDLDHLSIVFGLGSVFDPARDYYKQHVQRLKALPSN